MCFEDAVTLKAYNSATTNFIYFHNASGTWRFSTTNGGGFNYVERVCLEVEQER